MLLKKLKSLPLGYSEAVFEDKKYGVTRSEFNNGKSIKLYAKELGGNDFISLNYYITNQNELLKPCEIPEQKVIRFINQLKLI